MMRILGIDPGSNFTGYGIIEKENREFIHIDSGCISPPKDLPFQKRLLFIYEAIRAIMQEASPTCVAMEENFVSINAKSSLKLGQARGIAILAAAQEEIPLFEYPPNQVKIAVSGYGHASKEQIKELVKMRLRLKEVGRFDISDALAVALCHSQSLALGKIMR